MFAISYLVAIILGLALLALGWFLNQWLFINKTKDFRVLNKELQKENSKIQKKLNKEIKAVDQLKQKSESWKLEYQALTKESQERKKEIDSLRAQNAQTVTELEKNSSNLKIERDRLETALNKLKKEHERLQEKYKKDVADEKSWRTDRDNMAREIKNLETKVNKLNTIGVDYKNKYEAQAEQINKLRVIQRELRMTKSKANKLEEDVSYWEKKHYDTHHELAALKEETEVIKAKYSEVAELRKGDEILRTNLMEQIQEFKTKFVDVNNKYRELTRN